MPDIFEFAPIDCQKNMFKEIQNSPHPRWSIILACPSIWANWNVHALKHV